MGQEFKYCKYCGTQLSSNDMFCNTCGKKVDEKKDNASNETDKSKIFDIASKVLVMVAILFGFIALAFNLVKVSALGYTEKISGYKVIGHPDGFDGVGIWFMICSILTIIVTSILSIVGLLKLSKNNFSKLFCHLSFIISIIMSLLFMFNGIGALALTIDEVGGNNALISVITSSYIPFIIQAVLYISYFVCKNFQKRFSKK